MTQPSEEEIERLRLAWIRAQAASADEFPWRTRYEAEQEAKKAYYAAIGLSFEEDITLVNYYEK